MKIKLKERVTIETNEYKACKLACNRFIVQSKLSIPYVREMKLQHNTSEYVVVSVREFGKNSYYIETEENNESN
jgi:hypothetical protein